MRNTFIHSLIECAEKDPKIFLITADIGFLVVEKFAERFPDSFLNVGIAEQNAVGIAAGLALSGRTVYVYSIIPFVTMRCFEQIRVDVAYMNTNVKLVGVGAGVGYGPAGATHHAIEDIAMMRALPNMTVLCPGDPRETRELVQLSAQHKGPTYLRLGKGGEPVVQSDFSPTLVIGQAAQLSQGSDLAILATSTMLHSGEMITKALRSEGIAASLYSVHTLKPFDAQLVKTLVEKQIPIITLEEHSLIGGLGSATAEVIADLNRSVRFKRFALPDEYSHFVGSQEFIKRKYSLDFDSLLREIRLFLSLRC